MSEVKPITLPNGQVILMETDENITLPDDLSKFIKTESDDDGLSPRGYTDTALQKLQDLTGTLESLAAFIPNAIKQAGGANVEKVVFKFGVKLGGKAGIPYITQGSAEGNIEVEIECTFPNQTD